MGYDRGDSLPFDFEPNGIPFLHYIKPKSDCIYYAPIDLDQKIDAAQQPNGIPFGSKSKGKLSPRSYPIQGERKWNTSFFSVALKTAST